MAWINFAITTFVAFLPNGNLITSDAGKEKDSGGKIQEAYKYFCNTFDNFKGILSSSLNKQCCSCIALFLTIHFFSVSPFFSKLSDIKQLLTCVFFLVNSLLLLRFPPLINLEQELSLGCHAMLKSALSFGSYFLFNWVGVSMKLDEDFNLMTSSVCFLIYLLTIEARFHLEEEVAFCGGYLYAGFGMMMSQKGTPRWIVIIVCLAALTGKNYIQMSDLSVAVKDGGDETKGTTHFSNGRCYGFIALSFATHFFCVSPYFWTLSFTQQVFASCFFFITWLLLLEFPPLIKLEGRISLGFHVILKSALSFASYFLFNWVGDSMKLHEDFNLMTSSVCFLIYLLTIEARFHVEEEIALCEGYLFAGFGLMMNQKVIPWWIVIIVGPAALSAKNYIQMSWKKVAVHDMRGRIVKEQLANIIESTDVKTLISCFS